MPEPGDPQRAPGSPPAAAAPRPLPQLSLVLTMDKDKRPLHLVKSTGPEGTAWEEEHHAAQHRGHGVAFGDGRPLHSFIWPVETAIIPAPKSGC